MVADEISEAKATGDEISEAKATGDGQISSESVGCGFGTEAEVGILLRSFPPNVEKSDLDGVNVSCLQGRRRTNIKTGTMVR